MESGYAKTRVPNGKKGNAKMSKHYQFEANMTLSGANADYRFPTTATEQQFVLAALYGALTNQSFPTPLHAELKKKVTAIAAELKAAGNGAVVVVVPYNRRFPIGCGILAVICDLPLGVVVGRFKV